MPRLGSTRGCSEQRRQHRRPGHALMGTMDFKTDASAVTINLLLIVRPEEAASKEKGQREGQTEGGRGAGNNRACTGRGRAGLQLPAEKELQQLWSRIWASSPLTPLCTHAAKLQKANFFVEAQRVSADALLEPRSELCPVRLQCAQPRVHEQGHTGTPILGLCLHLAVSCAGLAVPPRALWAVQGRGLGSSTPHQHTLPWSTGAELFCLQRAQALSPRFTLLSHL